MKRDVVTHIMGEHCSQRDVATRDERWPDFGRVTSDVWRTPHMISGQISKLTSIDRACAHSAFYLVRFRHWSTKNGAKTISQAKLSLWTLEAKLRTRVQAIPYVYDMYVIKRVCMCVCLCICVRVSGWVRISTHTRFSVCEPVSVHTSGMISNDN